MAGRAALTGVTVDQWRWGSLGGWLRPWPNESSKDTVAHRAGEGVGVGRGGWTLSGGGGGGRRKRAAGDPRSHSALLVLEVRFPPIRAPRGGDGCRPVANEEERLAARSGRARALAPSSRAVLQPSRPGSVTQVTV